MNWQTDERGPFCETEHGTYYAHIETEMVPVEDNNPEQFKLGPPPVVPQTTLHLYLDDDLLGTFESSTAFIDAAQKDHDYRTQMWDKL